MGESVTTKAISVSSAVLARFRQPAYTGENRCVPCTVVNLVIAVAASGLVAVLSLPVGGLVFVVSVGTIYLRGYLVPGTPRLTKRYFPDWLLQHFDEGSVTAGTPVEEGPEIDPESVLVRAGALVECRDRNDLCLDEAFRAALYEHIVTEREAVEQPSRSRVAGMLAIDTGRFSFEERGEGFVARADGRPVGQWPSRAALFADSAAATLLADRDTEWEQRSPIERSQLLAGLRLFLDACPTCAGPLALGEETVESCCRSIEVVAVTCKKCDSKLFEIDHAAAEV
ncbi:hypothetical protein [Halococcus sp. AFM35]|uniref:hypothetical protein n=1 Tax=Halococcus sp. AFM35 TaxID=3421653 RepID=UPI003EBD9459